MTARIVLHLRIDTATVAKLGGSANKFPAEHRGEEVADVLELRHLPRPRHRIYQARNSLLQLM